MANRNAIHILKNTLIPSQSLPWSAYYGEPLVNLGDGIMFFSGGTSGAPTWVPSNANAAYFEVGSNLYDLKIRNQITHYNGLNNLAGKFLSGSTNGFVLADISSLGSITSFSYFNNALTITTSNGSYTATINDFTGLTITGPAYYQQNITNPTNTYEIANVGFVTAYTSSFESYVTGFTYNNANIISLTQNQGKPNFNVDISTLASITVNGNVTVTGTTTTGNLIVNNPSGTTAIIGQGGLIIGSGGNTSTAGVGDLIVHGNFFVYGSGTTIATNELYVEDPTILLNYNPSGSSTSTSIGAGIVIQDGSGIATTNSSLLIGQLYNNPNLNPNTEYTSPTGNANRGFFTQLNDIMVRNTNNDATQPNGKRLLAEDDILDGGSY